SSPRRMHRCARWMRLYVAFHEPPWRTIASASPSTLRRSANWSGSGPYATRSSAGGGGGSVRMSGAARGTARRCAFRVPMRLVSAAICALGAHALLYGSFRPAGGVHGYLGWYEPLLALVAIAAVVIVRPERLRTRLPLGDVVRTLSLPALLIVLVQE